MQDLSTSPQDIRHRIWQELVRATADRHHAWRTPVLATVDVQGLPRARTVVLRAADAHAGQLVFYTDGRSTKAQALAVRPDAMVVFWSKRLNWQLRVQARVSVLTSGSEVDTVWERVRRSAAAGDYLSPRAPGSLLPTGSLPVADAPTAPVPAHHHLVVLQAQVDNIDWLELGPEGHRRARLRADAWEWLTP